MTPAARVSAAIEILDKIFEGASAEKVLTTWARGNRYAGSKDRAAIRDHVFDVLRRRDSYLHLGGGSPDTPTGRAALIGALRTSGTNPSDLFTGARFAREPLTRHEQNQPEPAAHWDLPDWLQTRFETELPDAAFETAQALGQRAPVTIRVNLGTISRDAAITALHSSGYDARANARATTAITVHGAARGLTTHSLYQTGCIDLQDASSQAAVAALPAVDTVLDYCAGGGGKALALAAQGVARITAYDANPARMRDIPERAKRQNAQIEVATRLPDGRTYDLVLVDAPCSGSGTWRRAPDAKWSLTETDLQKTHALQESVLAEAAAFVGPKGVLAYATCSVFPSENQNQVSRFLQNNEAWEQFSEHNWRISANGDGFYLAQLKRV